ncbi:unnamed protein product [Ambrosiozyma monospora]|uniref:Unnamed protein product n=1 Tax=Ambrosiozyma monospora TaxID=43982 RepID=A0A9W6T6E8_AMBMO|nr:unnamed protein product [Ambrosiozyma monospora]
MFQLFSKLPTVLLQTRKVVRLISCRYMITAGQVDFKDLRTPVYGHINMVIACYSIDSSVSLANIQNVWIPEVKQLEATINSSIIFIDLFFLL